MLEAIRDIRGVYGIGLYDVLFPYDINREDFLINMISTDCNVHDPWWKECVESKLNGQTDSQRDYSAHL